jgi:uncharacterized repeat protein (TIGR02543 family)
MNTFMRAGYVFAGWSDGSTTYPESATYPSTGTISANVTLTATWTAATLTVTHDSQGGSTIVSGSTLTGATLSSPGTPTRSGFTFAGWFTASSGGTAITFPFVHGQTTNFTLYAQWTALPCSGGGICALGDTGPGGGIVFYVHEDDDDMFSSTGSDCASSCRYLEVAPVGWSTTTGCYKEGTSTTDPECVWSGVTSVEIGAAAKGTAVGSGYSNTLAMVAQSNTAGRAATVTWNYVNNGKSDWYLPSSGELAQLNARRAASGVCTTCYYWSSTELNNWRAWGLFFGDNGGYAYHYNKAHTYGQPVRPIRAFG